MSLHPSLEALKANPFVTANCREHLGLDEVDDAAWIPVEEAEIQEADHALAAQRAAEAERAAQEAAIEDAARRLKQLKVTRKKPDSGKAPARSVFARLFTKEEKPTPPKQPVFNPPFACGSSSPEFDASYRQYRADMAAWEKEHAAFMRAHPNLVTAN